MDERIARIASRQYGVFTRTQALRADATQATIKWRLRAGRWQRLHPCVYKLAGSPATWKQHAIAACLYFGHGSVLSHRAAALLRGMPGFRHAKVEVIVPGNRNRSRAMHIRIHSPKDPVPEEDISIIDGIPVTKPGRTLLDLATVMPEEVIERCLDEALRRRLVSLQFLERWLTDPRRKRHRGSTMLKRLVAERATTGATDSPLETQVLRLLREAGLPIPRLQYVVRDGERFVGRLDFAYPGERVAIEADGFRYHDDRRAFDHERARGNELQALGWYVLRVTSKHLELDPSAVVAWVRRALSSRRSARV